MDRDNILAELNRMKVEYLESDIEDIREEPDNMRGKKLTLVTVKFRQRRQYVYFRDREGALYAAVMAGMMGPAVSTKFE